MSKSSDRYKDPLYHRTHYQRRKEHILEWRRSPAQVAKQTAYRETHREQFREANRRYRKRHAEKLRAQRQTPEAKAKDKIRNRIAQMKRYGITPDHYNAMLSNQEGRCAICRTDKPGGHHKVFHVDHCHTSGAVRGLLCNNCNATLGHVYDNPSLLFAAAQYLLRYQEVREVS